MVTPLHPLLCGEGGRPVQWSSVKGRDGDGCLPNLGPERGHLQDWQCGGQTVTNILFARNVHY